MNGASLLRADAIRLPLADASVDLIVTSPPYWSLRSYRDGGEHFSGQIGSEPTPRDFLEALWTVTAECVRVLKPTGSLFVNLGDKYAGSGGHNNAGISQKSTLRGNGHVGGGPKIKSTLRSAPDRYNQAADVRAKSLMGLPWLYANGCTGALAALGGPDPGLNLILRAEIVWSKPNGLPESVQDRVRRSHEQWFHLTRQGEYFASVDHLREHPTSNRRGMTWEERKALDDGTPSRARYSTQNGHGGSGGMADHILGKLPGSVWTIATEPLTVPDWFGVDHFAAFPQEPPRRFITGWCPPDGVVLDPMGGTGTTAMVARALGRYGVTVDLSTDYLRLAHWRIFQSGHGAKSRSRSDGEAQQVLL